MTSIIFPPNPPVSRSEKIVFGPCEFDYLSDSNRRFIKDAYDVITRKELWYAFRNELLTRGVDIGTGFMFTSNPVYIKIQDAISSTNIGSGHTGFSMGYVMREMEFIALKGEPAYRLSVINGNQTPEE